MAQLCKTPRFLCVLFFSLIHPQVFFKMTLNSEKMEKNSRFFVGSLMIFLMIFTSLTSCANSPTGKLLEKSLSPDPILKEKPVTFGSSTTTPTPQISPETIKLPANFPSIIPLYPHAELVEVTPVEESPEVTKKLRWKTTDPANLIQNFYQTELGKKPWEIISDLPSDGQGILKATQNQLLLSFSLIPPKSGETTTQFLLEYSPNTTPVNQSSFPSISPTPSPSISPPSTPSIAPSIPANSSANSSTNLTDIPPELREVVGDVLNLRVIKFWQNNQLESVTSLPEPNAPITHREYARWLVETNNTIYGNRPAKKIRLGVPTSPPAFTDVPPTDPDFPAIQGLAEAGLIPSSLSSDFKETKFKPDQPLTRQTMILWKVPLDTRQVLPTANLDAVKEKWGFQDFSKIDLQSSRAVLADFNNGDLANIRRVFGFTTLFQPKKPVTRAEAVASLWYFGTQGEGLSAQDKLTTKGD